MKLSLVAVVAVVLLVCTAVDGQTCDGDIAQALQQCASSIAGGDSLSMQQEKCGCNYVYPASDDIDDLKQQYDDLSSMVKQLQTKLSDNTNDIQEVQATVAGNTNDIQQVQATVADNTNDIQQVQATVADNTNDIQQVQESVADNTDDIQQVQTTIADNTNEISNVKAAVANNTADIDSIIEHIEHPCGSAGWTRIAYLDMSEPGAVCPDEFMLYNVSGKAACGRPTSNTPSCDSVIFPNNISYSSVCGKVLGYQKGSPQAIYTGAGHNNLNSYYVDGVSITYGEAPNRQHIWTFMASFQEAGNGLFTCPCYIASTIVAVQSFIGDDYFCEAGFSSGTPNAATMYTDDPLWDGESCRFRESPCCQVPGLPWFTKTLSSATTENIELRICGDEGTANEDNPVFFYEIYVK